MALREKGILAQTGSSSGLGTESHGRRKEAELKAIEFNGVSKSFGNSKVLRGITFDVQMGALAGLVGVNGAGKTSLIKCLVDFCDLESGSIAIFGTPHTAIDARASLAFLPERFVPPHYLTGKQFLKEISRLSRVPFAENRIQSLLSDLDLEPNALVKPVRLLSKGMTQKLGLAASLLTQRRLLVLDEPMSGLDPKARACVKAKLRQLRATGTTIFMTSHSLADIEEICDHMLVLHNGTVVFSGTPAGFRAERGTPSLEQAFLQCIEGGHD